MNYVIKTNKLRKNYGSLTAVNNITLKVKKGEIYGFLGVNGAGKTTTIRLLLGMVKPTAGNCYLFDNEITHLPNELWNKIGYLVEDTHSYPELTVKENLKIVYKLRNLNQKNAINNIIDKLKLTKYQDFKVKNLSSGNIQRLGLAKALIHQPEILLLDEPTKGLDPAGIVEIRKLLKDLSENNDTTIFISSHILSEISKLVDKIGIINQGKLIQEVNNSELKKYKEKYLIINTNNNKKAREILEGHNLTIKENKEGYLKIKNKEAIESPDKIAVYLVEQDCPPTLLQIKEEDLESYFLRLTGLENKGEIFDEQN
ncbi:MAG: ABC transporter ATP-binding protein [Halanaerobiales bacterium]|nr:ABC transporter ATP-binding protein [Halanaerobiales bacterium]